MSSISRANHPGSLSAIHKAVSLILSLSLLMLVPHASTLAQMSLTTKMKNGKSATRSYPPGVVVASIVQGDSTISSSTLDMNEQLAVIVQFKTQPLAYSQISRRGVTINTVPSAQLMINDEHARFKADIASIGNSRKTGTHTTYSAGEVRLTYEYKTAFNGFALSGKRWMVEEIKKMPYVRSVYREQKFKTCDERSNHQIGADSIWARFGVTGKGIVIGIIDTGIDYLHPDLGGGIGPSFKIKGGYDFFNDDPDPMDDEGHGTHVAGIAAANGASLKGVAPDAGLYAFKVLDQNGYGLTSTILAGIERALDPDRNTATDDAVNIISMSLGGDGDPDDPLCQAIDNATASGVLCVIAAGNNGYYQTIGSPGCARTALTVGACDSTDAIAYFSSRGPSNGIFALKPDIVAPGVSIRSAKLGGGYIGASGTSMATPCVAGSAALLMQLHPKWRSSMVKSVLMETAKDLRGDVWTQGGGRVDLMNAAVRQTVITPASISYGVDDLSGRIWTHTDTLTIDNDSPVTQTFLIGTDGTTKPGMTFSFDRTIYTLPANSTGRVIVSMQVDNSVLPMAPGDPAAYTGKLLLTSLSQSIAIPYAVIKSPVLNLRFDEEPWLVTVFGRKTKTVKQIDYSSRNLSVLVPEDSYDISVFFQDPTYRVFVSNVTVSTRNLIYINKSSAKHLLTYSMKDEKSQPINLIWRAETYTHMGSDEGSMLLGYMGEDLFGRFNIHTSDMDSVFNYEWCGIGARNAKQIYKFIGSSTEIGGDINYHNDPALFYHRSFSINVPPELKNDNTIDLLEQTWRLFLKRTTGVLGIGVGINLSDYGPFTYPFIQHAFIQAAPADHAFQYFCKESDRLRFVTPMMRLIDSDTLSVEFPFEPSHRAFKTTSSTIPLNFGPPHWSGEFQNNSFGSISICSNRGGLFSQQLLENNSTSPSDTMFYALYAGQRLLQRGDLGSRLLAPPYYYFNNPDDAYRLSVTQQTHRMVSGVMQKLSLEAGMDTRIADPNPPAITTLNLLSNGQLVDHFDPAAVNQIAFSVNDKVLLQSVHLYYNTNGDTLWNELNLSNSGGVFTALLPPAFPSGLHSLRIRATDASENFIDYKAEPAFEYGTTNHAPSAFSLVLPANGDTVYLQKTASPIEFIWSAAKDIDWEDIVSYTVTLTGAGIDTSFVRIRDTVLRADIMKLLHKATPYTWSVIASDGKTGTSARSQSTFMTAPENLMAPVLLANARAINFDSLIIGNPIIKPLVITNPSVHTLIIDSIYTKSKQFTVAAQSIRLLQDESDTISISCVPDSLCAFIDTLYLHNNSPKPLVKIALNSQLPGVAISVEPRYYRYTELALGDSSAQSFVIRNLSVNELSFDCRGLTSTVFTIQGPTSGLIKTGDSAVISIQFHPTQFGEWMDKLKITLGKRVDYYWIWAACPYPMVSIPSAIIDLGRVNRGSILKKPVVIKNMSVNVLQIDSITTSLPQCTVENAAYPILLSGKDSSIIVLAFKPDTIKSYQGALCVRGNQRDSVSFFSIMGTGEIPSGVERHDVVPSVYGLMQNFPNPFNPTTTLQYGLPVNSHVKLHIYNLLGQQVAELVDADQTAGMYQVKWNANVASGLYFYRMEATSQTVPGHRFVDVKKMILMH